MSDLNPMLHSVNQGFAQEEAWYRCLEDEIAKADRGASAMFRRDDNVVWLSKKTGLKTPTYKLLSNGSAAEVIEPIAANGCASDFITEFFGSRTDAPICITALPNERGGGAPDTIYIRARDASKIEKFVTANDKAGWAIYFGVAPIIEGKVRNKENVAAIIVLHADLDHKGIIEKHDAILEVLKKLPKPPSMIVFSGHGIHCYWFLKEPMPVDETDRVEACLKQIARVLAGDPAVCEIARIMRLPGSHNSKDGDRLDVRVVGDRGPDYEFSDLEGWFSAADPVLTRVAPIEKEQKATSGNGHDPDAEDYNPWEKYEIDFKEPIDPDVELSQMCYHDSTGHGVDLTQYRCIGHYVHDGVSIDEAVNYVVDKTFELIRDAASWSRSEEVRKVRNMAVRTYLNHPEQLEKQPTLPKWLENDARIKKLLNSHESASPGVGPTENVVQFPANSTLPPKKPEKVLPRLPRISNKDLRRELLEHVSWVVDKIFVAGAVNGLFGDGAVGKDQLLYQLALAWISGAKWLGIDVPTTWNGEPIRVLWFPVEDPKKELRRRQHNIETYYVSPVLHRDEVFDPQDDNLQIIPPSACAFIWVKTNADGSVYVSDECPTTEDTFIGNGFVTRSNSEVVLFARKGSPLRLDAAVRQVVFAPVAEHSAKPEEVRNRIERLYAGPYLELYARKITPGWTCWGNEIQREQFREAAE